MKKILFLLIIIFVILPFCLYADDDRVPDRKYEAGLNIDVGFANNVLAINEIFQKTLVLDLDKLANGLFINLGIGAAPLYFNYDSGKGWGFGLSTGVDAQGVVGVSGNMLSFKQADNDKSDVSGAVFAQIQLSGFFYIDKFKIKIKPSIFYPIYYLEPDLSYTFKNVAAGTIIDLSYNLRVYSASQGSSPDLTALIGIDFNLGAEYPLSEVLGLTEKFSFLDFDVGVDIINIPMIPAQMKDYMEISGRIGSATPIDLSDLLSGEGGFDSFLTDAATVYGKDTKYILRPFKMLFWADWRPFETKIISFIPTLGFSISPFYSQSASFEAGIKARLDLSNRFIAALEIGYFDRLWKNSLDIAVNFRAVEINIGADLRAQDFVKSWSSGFGLRFGLKFGW